MPLKLTIVTSPSELPALCAMDHAGWQTPYNPQLKHFRPNLPTPEAAIAHTIEHRTKTLQAPEANTKRFMLKVVETDVDEVVGTAIWDVNDRPKPYGEKTQAVWHPEGSEEREFAEIFINGLWSYIGARVKAAHMDLLSLVTHPEHRRKGVGRMLIRWGIDKADELGIETVISSLLSARVPYERAGMGCIEVIPPSPELNRPYPSQKWMKLLEDDLRGWLMWRPIGHDFRPGLDKAPWTET